VSFGAGTVEARTMSPFSCQVSSVGGATNCAGVFEGNDKNDDLSGLFGAATWTRVVDYDSGPTGAIAPQNGITLTVDASTWSVDTYNGNSLVMFILKGGPTYSAFLMDTSVKSGSWDTLSMFTGGNNPKPGAGLSHWGIYTAGHTGGPGPNPAPVPLPAAGWMLLAALGGMAFWRRRVTA
jgi:hypothetical protein